MRAQHRRRTVLPVRRPRDPAYVASQHELRGLVEAALDELPAEDRRVIRLRAGRGDSWSFVAIALGRPSPQAAREQYRRARFRLKRILARRIGELSAPMPTRTPPADAPERGDPEA